MMAFPAHCKHKSETRAVTPAVSTVNSPFRRKTEVAFNVSVNSSHGNKLFEKKKAFKLNSSF